MYCWLCYWKILGYSALTKFMSTTQNCDASLTIHDSGWLVFKFNPEADKLAIMHGGPYSVFGRLLVLKAMPEFFYFSLADMSTVSIQVRFPNLPLECQYVACLSKIASVIGKPLYCDGLTNNMSRLSFARVMIEVDLLAILPNSINIILPNRGPMVQPIVYESLPKFCKFYRLLRHNITMCSKAAAARGQGSQLTDIAEKVSKVHPSSLGLFVETAVVVDQQGCQAMPPGEQLQSPNCTDVEAGAGVKARRKKTRLTSADVKNDKDMVPSTSSAIVHVLDDPL